MTRPSRFVEEKRQRGRNYQEGKGFYTTIRVTYFYIELCTFGLVYTVRKYRFTRSKNGVKCTKAYFLNVSFIVLYTSMCDHMSPYTLRMTS